MHERMDSENKRKPYFPRSLTGADMDAPGGLKIGWKACPYCGDHEVYRSRTEPLTWLDRLCPLFLLQLVRCHRCEFRHYRPIFVSTPEYPRPIRGRTESAQTNANDERPKRSA
jgi:hypothetical protein